MSYISPVGCLTRSSTHFTVQRDGRAYYRDERRTDQHASRKRVVESILRARSLDNDVSPVISAHLSSFELSTSWRHLTAPQRDSAVWTLYDNVRNAASGVLRGTVFPATHGATLSAHKNFNFGVVVMDVKYVKIIGLLGALLSGIYQCFSGDVAAGVGIVAAALSSAGAFTAD